VQERDAEYQVEPKLVDKGSLHFLRAHIADLAFIVFLIVLVEEYYSLISAYKVPLWDGAVYLTNARNWLTNTSIFEIYRPPMISWLIAGIWSFTGDDWIYAKPLAAVFTVAAGIILYLTLRRRKGNLFSLGVAVLTMAAPQVFFYGSQILPEGISLFFVLATLYCIKSEKPTHWLLAGACIGLTFASRYPIVLQAGALAVVESYARRNWRILARAIAGAVPVMAAVISIMFLRTGTFQTALPKDTVFTLMLSPYYLQNSVLAWSWIVLLVPLAFLLRGTYTDRYNYVFIVWFLLSMVFWSANATNFDLRYTIQFTPAVYFLALLPLEAFVKNSEALRAFLKRELVFFRRMPTGGVG
jgi:4-amino-4-deoxy-L-arabinose transferase-like glycosyltransferase